MGSLYYRNLLMQPERLDAMDRAIRLAVRQGDVVVDVGTGVGTYAVMAARAGASIVYAIEPGRVAEIAAKVFEVNGVSDRITIIRQRIEEVDLPRKADLLITEDFAPWLYDEHLHDLLLYSRSDILKKGGGIIPSKVTVCACPWGGPVTDSTDPGWRHRPGMPDSDTGDITGIDFSPLESLAVNTPDPYGIPPGGPLADGTDLFVWDLTLLEPGSYSSNARWIVKRDGSIWGIGLWMEMELWEGVHYSNAPGEKESSWGQGHFPLTAPLEVGPGTVVEAIVETRTDPAGMVWWSWKVWIDGNRSETREGNTFGALPFGDDRRRVLDKQGRLPLSRWAEIDAYLLKALTEKNLAEAAADALEIFPDLLVDEARASRRASSIRERYLAGSDNTVEGKNA